MKSTLILALIALVSALPAAQAGSVSVMVSDNPKARCPKPDSPENEQYILSSKETAEALDRYFREESNPSDYDAAFVNGKLKFCGPKERDKIFALILKALEKRNPDRRAFEIYVVFDRVPQMRKMAGDKFRASENGVNPDFISNIRAGRAMADKAHKSGN